MLRPLTMLATPAAVCALVLTGCAGTTATPAPSSPPASSTAPGPAGFPVTIQNCGRSLTFNRPPSRVVTGYEPVLETLLALGLQDRIVGRTNFAENGPDGFLPGHKELYEKIPEISDTISLPPKEILLALRPDFVIDVSASVFNAAKGQATISELDGSGAPVFITGGWCDTEGVRNFKIEDTIQDVRTLGKIFGVPDRAEQLATEFENTLADVRKRVSGLTPVKVLAIDSGEGPANAYGGTGLTNQIITTAGGENVLADINEDYTEVSTERIAASAPEAVLVADYITLAGQAQPTAPAKADAIFKIIPNSPAAKQHHYLAVPVVGQHPGYRNIVTIVAVAKFLHPDAFS